MLLQLAFIWGPVFFCGTSLNPPRNFVSSIFNGVDHIPLPRYCGSGVITHKSFRNESGRDDKNQRPGWLVSLVIGDCLASHLLD